MNHTSEQKKIMTRLIFAFILSILATTVFSQASPELNTDKVGIHDTIALRGDTMAVTPEKVRSVFDINWVTNSIKGGWKISDSLMIGMGLEPCDSLHPFIMPVDGKFWRGCTYYHSGWDIGCDYGTPVQSALWGKVRFAGYCSGYGKLVIVRHYTGLELYYAHLSKILVSVDQYVDAGDTLGLVGATGRARGNHLHLEFRLRDRALDIADYYVQNDTTVNLYKIFETTKKQALPQGEEYYTVVRGDTLWDIANRHGTSVTSLCTINSISKNSTLRIGQKLKVQ
jgi:murein DD-endopeptidase MepM/ murein hydrolase activator NlpD